MKSDVINDFIPKDIKLGFNLHYDTGQFQQKLNNTIYQILTVLNKFDKPYVSVSGGKDSMVMLHLINKLKRQEDNIWIRHWDYGRALVPGPIELEIIENINFHKRDMKLCIEHRPEGDTEVARNSNVSDSGYFVNLISAIKKHNWDHCFLGVRASESTQRKHRISKLSKYDKEIEPGKGGLTSTSFPLAYWDGKDVWSYIVRNNVNVPSVYGLLAKSHGSFEKARLVTLFDREYEHLGELERSGVFFSEYRHNYDTIDIDYCCP